MQNMPSELIITVKNYMNITSFKMKGSPDPGQAARPFLIGFYSEYGLYAHFADRVLKPHQWSLSKQTILRSWKLVQQKFQN